MLKSTLAAAILATATSFAVAQTGGAAATSTGVTEGASQANVSPAKAKTAKTTKAKKSMKSNTATGSSGTDGTTGATGTTAAGTDGQSTSGATKPAGDASMKH